MKIVFVRILGVSGLPATFSQHAHQVFVKILPAKEGTYGDLIGTTNLTCESSWNFVYENAQDHSLCFAFFETDPQRRELARLTLPMKWFPANAVVIEDFPCRMLLPALKNNTAMARLQIHLSENGENAFTAREGRLLVKPAWKKPETVKDDRKEVPPPPVQEQQVQYRPYAYPGYQQPMYPYGMPYVPQVPPGYAMPMPQVPPQYVQYQMRPQYVQPQYVQPQVVVQPKPQTIVKLPPVPPEFREEKVTPQPMPMPVPVPKPKQRREEVDQSLGVPSLDAPDEEPISALGNERLLEDDLKPIDIGAAKPSGGRDPSLSKPLIDTNANSGSFLPQYPPE